MSENQTEKEYPKLRPLTKIHLKNLYNEQIKDNCSKVDSKIGKIKCNLCQYETDLELLHYGRVNRPNERCPNCYSLKRTRLLWYYLENKTDIFKKEDVRILHTAPETAIYKRVKEDFKDRYISSDIYESEFVDEIVDIQDIPFPDNTFDVIVTSHVLEHVPDDRLALQEFYRVLKPNGKVVILIPTLDSLKKTFELPQINIPELRQRYYKQSDHRRYYSADDFYNLLELAGFKTIKEDKLFLKNKPEIKLRHSLSDDPIFVATKIVDEDKKQKNNTKNDFCTICESKVTFNTDKMNDKICSQCNATSHERLLYSHSHKFISNNSKILYINPKETLNSKLNSITENITVLTDNNNETSILEQLKSISNDSFDMILTDHFLDRQINDTLYLDELSRILRKGGKLYLKENMDLDLLHKIEDESINTPKLKGMFYGNPRANRCYAIDFIGLIRNKGFEVEYENPIKQEDNIKLKDELIKDPLLICTKK